MGTIRTMGVILGPLHTSKFNLDYSAMSYLRAVFSLPSCYRISRPTWAGRGKSGKSLTHHPELPTLI